MSYRTGDTAPLTGQVNASLTGATTVLHIKKPDGVVLTKTPVVVSAADGTWRYQWAANELDTVGRWYVEAQVTFADGVIQTYGPQSFLVTEQLA